MRRNQKGITLIALVITIIVLLILAGVSIAMLTGKNGILTRASESSEASIVGEIDEAVKLGIAEIVTNQMDPTFNSAASGVVVNKDLTVDNVAKAITQNNANLTATAGEATIPTTGGGNIQVTVAGGDEDNKVATAGSPITVKWTNGDKTGAHTYTWSIDENGKITKTNT